MVFKLEKIASSVNSIGTSSCWRTIGTASARCKISASGRASVAGGSVVLWEHTSRVRRSGCVISTSAGMYCGLTRRVFPFGSKPLISPAP